MPLFGPQLDVSSPALHFASPRHSRILSRIEAYVPEWGRAHIFNQPKSAATLAPPPTILGYAIAQKQLATNEMDHVDDTKSFRALRESSIDQIVVPTYERHKGVSRSAWTIEPAIQGNGPLSNALQSAVDSGLLKDGLHHFGTLGFPTDSLSNPKRQEIAECLESNYDAHAVFVKDEDLDGHYVHFCKIMLWPILNYQIPDHPKSKAYADHSWRHYVKVNEAFAEAIVRKYGHDDSIWINDYHLLLLPAMLRKRLPHARIGFFLHTAFPSSEVFRCLAMRKELLDGILGANAIGFQAREYARHFLQTCSEILSVRATDTGVRLENRFVDVFYHPVGISSGALLSIRTDHDVIQWASILQQKYKDKCVIASRERLDSTRGIKQQLLSFEIFLEKYPEWREKAVLISVAIPTAGNDKDYDAAVSEIVTRINSKFSTLAHSPLTFLKQDIAYTQYLALLGHADVFMVTPLRDGLNLSCHEYIECQDGRGNTPKKHGPLILSNFTGNAEIFKGNELAVNPWDLHQMARAIHYGLTIQPDERERRYDTLAEIVKCHDSVRWLEQLTQRLKTG